MMISKKPVLEITYDEVDRIYRLELPVSLCDNLLLDANGKKMILCHSQRAVLEQFREVLVDADIAAVSWERQSSRSVTKKVIFYIAILLLIFVLIMFKEQLLAQLPSLKWPIWIGVPLLGVYTCYRLFIIYVFPSGKTLSDQLFLLELHRQIKEDFSCPGGSRGSM